MGFTKGREIIITSNSTVTFSYKTVHTNSLSHECRGCKFIPASIDCVRLCFTRTRTDKVRVINIFKSLLDEATIFMFSMY